MEKNKITIPISDNSLLVYRETHISKAVLLVKKLPPQPNRLFDEGETEQSVLATSAAGCDVLASALKEMAQKMRERKQED